MSHRGKLSGNASSSVPLRVYEVALSVAVPIDQVSFCDIQVNAGSSIDEDLKKAGNLLSGVEDSSWLTMSFSPIWDDVRKDSSKYSNYYLSNIYGVTPEGYAVSRSNTSEVTWAELWRATDDGIYPPGMRSEIAITRDGGWGGGGPQILTDPATMIMVGWVSSFFLQTASGLVVGAILKAGARRARGRRAPRRVRLVAEKWAERGFGDIDRLVQYVFSRPRWTPDFLGARLGIGPRDAETLLKLCGWEMNVQEHQWTPNRFPSEVDALEDIRFKDAMLSTSKSIGYL